MCAATTPYKDKEDTTESLGGVLMDWILGGLMVMWAMWFTNKKRRRCRVKGTQYKKPISGYYEPRGWRR